MNMEKFTERSRGFLQAAQTIAMREGHQRLTPEHLLKALMDDDQGLSANLIRRAGGEPARVVESVDLAVSKLGRLAGHDLEDIKALAGMGLISAEGVRERAEFALAAYVGNTDRAKTNIDIAVKTIKSIGK